MHALICAFIVLFNLAAFANIRCEDIFQGPSKSAGNMASPFPMTLTDRHQQILSEIFDHLRTYKKDHGEGRHLKETETFIAEKMGHIAMELKAIGIKATIEPDTIVIRGRNDKTKLHRLTFSRLQIDFNNSGLLGRIVKFTWQRDVKLIYSPVENWVFDAKGKFNHDKKILFLPDLLMSTAESLGVTYHELFHFILRMNKSSFKKLFFRPIEFIISKASREGLVPAAFPSSPYAKGLSFDELITWAVSIIHLDSVKYGEKVNPDTILDALWVVQEISQQVIQIGEDVAAASKNLNLTNFLNWRVYDQQRLNIFLPIFSQGSLQKVSQGAQDWLSGDSLAYGNLYLFGDRKKRIDREGMLKEFQIETAKAVALARFNLLYIEGSAENLDSPKIKRRLSLFLQSQQRFMSEFGRSSLSDEQVTEVAIQIRHKADNSPALPE